MDMTFNKFISSRFDKFSDWNRLVKGIAYLLRCAHSEPWIKRDSDTSDTLKSLDKAEIYLVKVAQREAYETEVECIQNGQHLQNSSTLS